MNPANFSVRRPVAMACLIIALGFLGVNAFRGIQLEYLPRVDAPFVTVVTAYPGASPQELETDIIRKLEDAITTVEGVKHITSIALENVATIIVEFELSVESQTASTDVREKIDLIRSELPTNAEDPVVLALNINSIPIVNLALTGAVAADDMYDYADQVLAPRLSTIQGVAEVRLVGGAEREVHVSLDRSRLAAHGLTATQVVQAIQQGIQTMPAGRVRQHGSEFSVKFDAEYRTVKEIGELQVAGRDGARLYLRDIAKLGFAPEEERQAAYINGEPAIAIRIVKKSEANAAAVVERVRAQLDSVKETLPGGMDLVWVSDEGAFIQAAADSAMVNIAQGIGLTALILLLFLVDLRSTLIVAVTMPVTYVIAVFFLRMLDFTLNMSTLLAVGLSVGVLVTNSIVVLERIIKRLDELGDAREASRIGATDVAIAVLASALTNIVVLFPVATMGGMVGRFLSPFATTMIIVTAVSLFVSFTLTPLLASKLLRGRAVGDRRGWLDRLAERQRAAMDRLSGRYGRGLAWFARRRWAIVVLLAGVVAMVIGIGGQAGKLGFSLVPDSDKGEVLVKLEYSARTELGETIERVKDVEARLRDMDGLQHIYTTVGKVEAGLGMASEGVHLAQVFLKFIPRTERQTTLEDLVAEVRRRLDGHAGGIVTVGWPGVVGGQSAPIELSITGPSLEKLDELANTIEGIAKRIPETVSPDTTVRPGKPELRVRPRRAVLADLGLPASGVGLNLRANLAGLVAGTYKEGSRSYDIRVKLAEEEGKDQVEEFLFPAAPGRPLVLGTLAKVEEERAPVQVVRLDKERTSKLLAYMAEGVPLGAAVEALREAILAEVKLPPGYGLRFTGEYEAMAESTAEFGQALLIAIVLTFLVLAAILESFKQPFLILVTLPLAAIGVVLGLLVAGESLSIFALLGVVMLIGIVVNNAILVMESLNKYRADGVPPAEAMVRASAEQLRPVLMITLAAALGMVPLALGTGLGAEPRVGIGAASIAGILISGALTLVVLPSLYLLFARRAPVVSGEAPTATNADTDTAADGGQETN